jgi:acyl-CoA synthetase (NDP forming)
VTAPALGPLLEPESLAIIGLSDDASKHGGRVLANLRKLGYGGRVWGVNPRLPEVEGAAVFASVDDLPGVPDLVVCAVPAPVVPGVVAAAGELGVGAAVVFAGGFAESGAAGESLQEALKAAAATGIRVLGPNSGGVIRPSHGLAVSFLTCLDRPAEQVRSGPVGLVTQSGGTGSYIHNLAAARGGGLAASVSTGNEVDIQLGEAVAAVAAISEVRAVAVVVEAVRDGTAFVEAVEAAHRQGKPVVVCRIGGSRAGSRLTATHTGAIATPARVLDGVLDALGVTVTETPGELLDVAEVMARTPPPAGPRVGIVTHSGGVAILLADLASRAGVPLPEPDADLSAALAPLLDHGAARNPLDMGGIIGGPGRFAAVVDLFAGSGLFDSVLAVSTAHPPAHTRERAATLAALDTPRPVVHLWMAGDVGEAGLAVLREAGRAVVEEPRAAVRALAGLGRRSGLGAGRALAPRIEEPVPLPDSEHAAKQVLAGWGIDVPEGAVAGDAEAAAAIARRLGGPVVVKVSSPSIRHKTEVSGVKLGVVGAGAARRAFREVVASASRSLPAAQILGALVEREISGPEVMVGAVTDPVFGPMMVVSLGGVAVEELGAEALAPAPLDRAGAERLVSRVRGLATTLTRRGEAGAALPALAAAVQRLSERFVASSLDQVEINPLVWAGRAWVALDAVMVAGEKE